MRAGVSRPVLIELEQLGLGFSGLIGPFVASIFLLLSGWAHAGLDLVCNLCVIALSRQKQNKEGRVGWVVGAGFATRGWVHVAQGEGHI